MRLFRGRIWDMRVVVLSVLTVLVALLLWETPALVPIKMFVVLLHEISHGIAALLTGGKVETLQLLPNEGGLAKTRGGNNFLITSAGYLGSALWGALLMRLAWIEPYWRRVAVQWSWVGLIFILALYVRDPYTWLYVAIATFIIFVMARQGPDLLLRSVIWILGSFSCLYAVIDITTDILFQGPLAGIPLFDTTPGFPNDAEALANMTWIPAFVWGLIWGALAVAIFAWSLYRLASRPYKKKKPASE